MCKLNKSFNEFHKNKRNKDGLKRTCKLCRKEESLKYYRNNKKKYEKYRKENSDIIRRKRKEYRQKNIEKIKIKEKEYRDNNKEKRKIQFKRWYDDNRDYNIERSKNYKKANKKAVNEYHKNYYRRLRKDEFYNCKLKIRGRIREVLRKGNFTKKSKTSCILGCDYIKFFNHLCSSFEENYGIARQHIPWDDVHIDHIVPLSIATNMETIYQLNHYKNLQLLFSEDNLKKGSKHGKN